jgi:hypothetical protein
LGGIDTIRGIAFQQACALGDALDLVTRPDAAVVRVEGREEVVDFETAAADGRRLRICQAKTRQAPKTWSADEIIALLNAWADLDDADDAVFAFVTDGQLSRSGVALQRVLEAAKAGATQAEVDALAQETGRLVSTMPLASLLGRVELLTRFGTVGSVLDRVELRVLRLMERARVVTTEDASAAVDRLFRTLFVVGGERQPQRREVTRRQVLDLLGLADEDLAAAHAWDAKVRTAYRDRVLEEPTQPGLAVLDVLQVDAGPKVLRLLDGPIPAEGTGAEPPGTLLDDRQVSLVGPTGTGKTTTLAMLRRIAAERGAVPVLLRADGHLPGTLGRRLHEAVTNVLGSRLTVGGVERLRADQDLLLLVDGVSEVDENTRAALRHDLRALAAQRPLGVVASGRDLATTRSVLPDATSVSAFSLVRLSAADRRQIARARLGRDAGRDVAQIEETLGDAVDNPLLFAMAIAVREQGGSVDSRPQVYREFLAGLAARAGLVETDTRFAALGMAWSELLAGSHRAADGYEWRRLVAEALDRLARTAPFAGHGVTAGQVLEDAQAMGLLTRPDLDVGLVPLHDSFADYLAGAAVAHGWVALPSPLVPALDEQVLFATQLAGLDDALADRLVVEHPLLACRVAALPGVERGSAQPERVGVLLAELAAGATLEPLAGRRGVCVLDAADVLGVVLVDGQSRRIDLAEFHRLAAANPSWLLPAGSGSLAAAVNVWASAVRVALRPRRRGRPTPVPDDPDAVVRALIDYETACAALLRTTVRRVLPSPAVGNRVLEALGEGLVAVVDDPQSVPGGRAEVWATYQRGGGQILVVRQGDSRVDPSQLSSNGAVERLLRPDPAAAVARRILATLTELTDETWPAP